MKHLFQNRKMIVGFLAGATLLIGNTATCAAPVPPTASELPEPTLAATAFRIMEGTHNRESAYSSITVADNNKIYVGPASYGTNAFLVELDSANGAQRVVVDTHKLCNLNVTGFPAQSKIHTRLVVAPSGKIYFGSKQGYPPKGESHYTYLGGYLMSYDPATDQASNLGKIPFRGHGVYDVAVDETRQLMHITSCADELGDYFWFLMDMRSGHIEGMGPRLQVNAHPLMTPDGNSVYVLTHDGMMARYRPDDNELTVRPMVLTTGETFAPTGSIVQCTMAPDGRSAFLLPSGRPEIYEVRFDGEGESYPVELVARYSTAASCSTMDPIFAPDGKLYCVSRWQEPDKSRNKFLHVVAYDPSTRTAQDHGVLQISNPDALKAVLRPETPIGKAPYHGVQVLSDTVLAPKYAQGIAAAADGTIYVMTLNPLCVLRLDDLRAAPPPSTR